MNGRCANVAEYLYFSRVHATTTRLPQDSPNPRRFFALSKTVHVEFVLVAEEWQGTLPPCPGSAAPKLWYTELDLQQVETSDKKTRVTSYIQFFTIAAKQPQSVHPWF